MNRAFGCETRRDRLCLFFACMVICCPAVGVAAGELPYENEPINYPYVPPNDPVASLQARIDRNEVELKYEDRHGYLPAVLEALRVPVSSQMLVFTKTSFQRDRISPQAPRAVYFNDDVYIGWVQGGDVLEISTVDPQQGAMFYLLSQRRDQKPEFARQTHQCLQCHASSQTQEVPGHLVRSLYPERSGIPNYRAGGFVSSHASPFEERWGGWYVTGTHGPQRHMGNVFVTDHRKPENLDTEAGANVVDLSDRFNTAPYLAKHSDIVALMVLEHQTQMQNWITATNYQARIALYHEAGMNQALGRPAEAVSPQTERRFKSAADHLLKYLLFVDESPLTASVAGTSSFAHEFASRGPRDHLGRSLRDFDLERRLFRYPCSYLIDSEAFDALPARVKDYVYQRLWNILTNNDHSPDFAGLSADDRQAILEILVETKPDLPASWKQPKP
jgi:hypothetical protein